MSDRRRFRARGVALGAVVSIALGASGGLVFARLSDTESTAQATPLRPLRAGPALAAPIFGVPPPTPRASAGATRKRTVKATKPCGTAGRVVSFRVTVQKGLDTTRQEFVDDVLSVLCHERSWIASGRVRFRYDPDARLLIGLRSASATERRCLQLIGLSVREKYSCASVREIVLNADRWFEGSPWWPGSVKEYRRLLVNHEVGHVLGHGHAGCTKAGGRAPVMMQQSKGVGGCRPNPWPLPYELRSTR